MWTGRTVSRSIKTPTILACLFAVTSLSQTAPEFHSKIELVAVPCTVVDANGSTVVGLNRDEFRVYDNGVRRIIQNFWFDTDEPLTLGIIIDASESQREQVAEHRRAAMEILERVLRPGDRAFVISVDEHVSLWVDLAATAAEVRDQMSRQGGDSFGEPCPATVCGASPLWNAIYDAARLKLRPLNGNKALLILTDGYDTGSTHTWHEAANEVHRADATLYAIQYFSGFGGRHVPDLYRLLAEAGGTRFAEPRGDYSRIVSRLNTDLRQRYVLGFRPEILSGKVRHDLNVEVTRSELSVRARKTYFQEAR
jgi:Ca-activated chloride channel homolog